MVSTAPASSTNAWARAIAQPAREFAATPLKLLQGQLPPNLRGSLYRNGPGRLERGGTTMGHWFDGDGGLLRVHFTGESATATYRYVQTQGYQEETRAGRLLWGGYGMLPPGSLWERFSKTLKNPANTSVIALEDRLLALWEGGSPHALTPDTLDTIGLETPRGLEGIPYSAHPKRDPGTGDIFNFGITFGLKGILNVYRSDARGTLLQKATVSLPGFPVIHDFVLAGRYLVFCVPPVRMQALPVLARLQSYSDSLEWQPEAGSEIIVIDRDTLQVVCRLAAEPWYQWHFGNGYELPDGSITLHIARYPDFQTNQRLKEVASQELKTPAISTLWQLRIDPQTQKILEWQEVLNRSCEFPVVHPAQVGQPHRYTYLSTHSASADTLQELFNGIARFDHETGNLTEAALAETLYPSEPIVAPDAANPQQAWIVTVVYNSVADRSEVLVFDSDHLDTGPVCSLELPRVIPHSFHGTWQGNP